MSSEEKLWQVCEFQTVGWRPYDATSINLTREQAKEKIAELLSEGVAIYRIRAFSMNTNLSDEPSYGRSPNDS